ncbi:MAG TPA: T9SS type A sorting domain-containing protein, partial [Candidatus Kapabacteria bacterium]|nr:T9SS type A sorting domain-containing protein [Candidatus Kapabacteria bacterium]
SNCFAINQLGFIFAGTNLGAIRSTDDGISWTNIGPNYPVTSLSFGSNGRLFASTGFPFQDDHGLWRSIHSTLDVNSNEVVQPRMNPVNNFPNPFNYSTSIRFTLPEPSYITLKLFDATGREVATLANGFFASGEHDLPFARGTLPAGVYFYRLEAGGQSVTHAIVVE